MKILQALLRALFARKGFTAVAFRFFAFFSLATILAVGASLEGNVLDPTGARVRNASIRLLSRDGAAVRATRSDASGAFRFDNLPAGEFLLVLEAPGFPAQSLALKLDTMENRQEEFTLSLASYRTSVQVTASGSPLQLEEIAKAGDAVSAQEITDRNEFSLADAVRLLPGVRVSQLGGPGNLTSIQIRGLRSQDTAVLFDGLRVRDAADPQGSPSPFLEVLNMMDTASVEVLRGSGSSLYGSHAIGGALNIRGEEGGGPWRAQVLSEGGGLGMLRGLARTSGSVGERLLVSAGLGHLNVRDGVAGANPHRNTHGQGFARYLISPGMSVSGRVTGITAWTRLTDSPFVAAGQQGNIPASGIIPARPLNDGQLLNLERGLPVLFGNSNYVPAPNDPDYARAATLMNYAANFRHEISPLASWRLSYQGLDSQRRFDDGPAGRNFEPQFSNRSRYDGRIHLLQARADVQPLRSHLLTFFYEREQERYANRNSDENPNLAARASDSAIVNQSSNSFAAQDQVQLLSGALRVSLSGRLQNFAMDTPQFAGASSPYAGTERSFQAPPRALTGDIATAYLVSRTNTKLRAHVGNAYRAPSAYERFGTFFFFGSFSAYGDPRLRPERALSLDAGIDQWLAGDRVQLSATVFYTRIQDIIRFDFSGLIPPDDPYGRFGGYINGKGGLARGVELSARMRPHRSAVVQASYTYQNADDRTPPVAGTASLSSLRVSPHLASLLWTQWLGERLSVTTDLSYASSYPIPIFAGTGSRTFLFEGPLKIDTVANYRLKDWERGTLHLYGKVENLLDRQFYESGFRNPGRWALLGLRLEF
jgi:iron complex outermembrane receptor protein